MTDDEVLRILKLIEESSFDFMDLQVGDLKLTVSKSVQGAGGAERPALSVVAEPPPSTEAPPRLKEPEVERSRPEPRDVGVREGALPIKAPMVGTFYSTPEPGAAPFVEVGGTVEEDTTVGLIEVMKVFSAVSSGVRGTIAEICVQSGQFVEYGQTLFWVTPGNPAGEGGPSG